MSYYAYQKIGGSWECIGCHGSFLGAMRHAQNIADIINQEIKVRGWDGTEVGRAHPFQMAVPWAKEGF